jgi:uroporphyrinogen decarboxylase
MQLDVIDLLGAELDAPLVQTIYSPLVQAEQLAGREQVLLDMRQNPDRLKTGLNHLTDTILRQLDTMKGIAGIFYEIHHADYTIMSEAEYREFGLPYDLRVLEYVPRTWWLNGVAAVGNHPMLELLATYPVQVLNWQDRASDWTLNDGKLVFGGAVCGGLHAHEVMLTGTPGAVREQAREAMLQTMSRRFILSTGKPMLIPTPLSNIRMARDVVEPVRTS